ncbi:MAG: hypothetical protein HY046_07595 [Acidobacteria bacterium]|nr:hypothetical protein [Acidobacteriota bacterium]
MRPRSSKPARQPSHELLSAALDFLKSFEQNSIERLTRVEESLRLMRQDLIGNGQPGRIPQLEKSLGQVRDEQIRERGILAGISLAISTAVGLLSRLLHF